MDLFYQPREIITQYVSYASEGPEMSEFESAFLCGLIRERKPQKILEVGVAAGGTTAIILECLFLVGINAATEVHSVDISEHYYRGTGERTGYLAEIAKKSINATFNHHYYLGNVLPSYIEQIGNNIDFVILDTTHELPGELLDFLAIFPFLSENACIVLHDIANNHYGNYKSAFATQVLLDTVVADKTIVPDKSRENNYPNIASFSLNEISKKYISDCFNALIITWQYSLDANQLTLYKQLFYEKYSKDLVDLFSSICEMQQHTQQKQAVIEAALKNDILEQNTSYKIGRFITWIPREIKHIVIKYRRLLNNK